MNYATFLSNVPLSTADLLSYVMLVLVSIFLIAGAAMAYFLWKKRRETNSASPTDSALSPSVSGRA